MALVGRGESLVAYQAGPRRDPLSRTAHVEKLVESGKCVATPSNRNLRDNPAGSQMIFGGGVVVPHGMTNSWETDLAAHCRRQPIHWPATDASNPAGATHANLGIFADYRGGPVASAHYGHQTKGFTDEEQRGFLLQGERHRRFAAKRHECTDTLGMMCDDGSRWQTSSSSAHSHASSFLPRY